MRAHFGLSTVIVFAAVGCAVASHRSRTEQALPNQQTNMPIIEHQYYPLFTHGVYRGWWEGIRWEVQFHFMGSNLVVTFSQLLSNEPQPNPDQVSSILQLQGQVRGPIIGLVQLHGSHGWSVSQMCSGVLESILESETCDPINGLVAWPPHTFRLQGRRQNDPEKMRIYFTPRLANPELSAGLLELELTFIPWSGEEWPPVLSLEGMLSASTASTGHEPDPNPYYTVLISLVGEAGSCNEAIVTPRPDQRLDIVSSLVSFVIHSSMKDGINPCMTESQELFDDVNLQQLESVYAIGRRDSCLVCVPTPERGEAVLAGVLFCLDDEAKLVNCPSEARDEFSAACTEMVKVALW